MPNLLIVFLGGGLGSVLRYLAKVLWEENSSFVFPYPTFIVNILGSLFLGFVAGLIMYKANFLSPSMRIFLMVGIAGGFTTFSSYSLEIVSLFRNGHFYMALFYSVGSVIISLLAIVLGGLLSKSLWG